MKLIEHFRKYKSLYVIEFPDKESVVFRPLSFDEFKAYRSLLRIQPHREEDIKDEIYDECVIEGRALDEDMPAGMISTISDFIYKISGPDNAMQLFEDINEVRLVNQLSPELRILATTASVMGLKMSDFDDMTYEDILNNVAQGEMMLSGQRLKTPYAIKEPEPEKSDKIDFEKENNQLISN